MAVSEKLPISSCWIVTEGLIGLQNQAIGLAQALGVSYALKQVKKSSWWTLGMSPLQGFKAPWPDLLITCGRQSVAVSCAIRRASRGKTFTVHIQDPLIDPEHFDAVVVPAHDQLQGPNVLVTQGAIHHVTEEKLQQAAIQFRPLLSSLNRPLVSVLVGGKNKHQAFTPDLAHDFAQKLLMVKDSGCGLAISFSRRTGAVNEAILRKALINTSAYIWDGKTENPYFGFLALSDAIIVTSDSISMLSESCSTGKPVYIYELPRAGSRHRRLVNSLIEAGQARFFTGRIESWTYAPLQETQKAADFVTEIFFQKIGREQKLCRP